MFNQNFVQVFDSSSKEIETKSSKAGEHKTILPLPHYNIFIAFNDGRWLLFDYIGNKLIKEDVVAGDPSKFVTPIKAPKALDENHIVYVNCSNFKLQCLDPFSGKIHKEWNCEVPTEEGLPLDDRLNDTKVGKAYANLDIEVLTKSRIVGILERKDNNEYLVTVFKENEPKRLMQLNRDSGGKILKLRNGNKENTFVLYTVDQSYLIKLLVLDVREKSATGATGFKVVELAVPLICTVVNLFPWKDNSIIIFGNKSDGYPFQVTHSLTVDDSTNFGAMNCSYLGEKTILKNVMHVDEAKNRVLLKETGSSECTINVWNTYLSANEFVRKQLQSKDWVASTDGSYFVEYDRNTKGKTNKVGLTLSRLVTKKMLLLFVMKYAIINDKTFISMHGKADIFIDVTRMLAKEY